MKPGPAADEVLVAHMLDCIGRIERYTSGRDRAVFDGSSLVQDAVVRNLQTLAESSQRLSTDLKATEPGTPWRELSGFRNVIVHAYLSVDLGAVWSIVEADLPGLRAALLRMAARAASPP